MFHDLFWALYWIDVLSGVINHFLGASAAAILGFSAVMALTGGTEPKWGSALAAAAFVCTMLFVFIPSKQTMYMMLGARTTETAINSDLGKKLQTIINKEVDDWLKKYEGEK